MKGTRRITVGILLVTLSVFIGVALASYDQRDWGSFWRVRNLCGPIGSLLAGFLRLVFGTTFSWFWPLFLFYWALETFRGMNLRDEGRRITVLFVLLWSLVAIVAAWGAGEAGGVIGQRTIGFLELISGRIGSILILVAVLLLTALILLFGSLKAFVATLRGLSFFGERRQKIAVKPRISLQKKKPKPIPKVVHGTAEKEEPPVKIALAEPGRPVAKRMARPSISPIGSCPSALTAPLPDISLLNDYDEREIAFNRDELLARSDIIERKLKDYSLDGKVKKVRPGPVVTTFEFVPASGVKVSQIASRSDDISLALAAKAIRIQAPIPGKGAVGIEVPNLEPKLVQLKELMEHYPIGKEGLWIALGKTVTGEPVFADLADMPHLLIAGATGSGKSVCINSIICSLLFHHTPATCRFILVDPKMLELITYNGIPHLLHPVIIDARATLKALQWMTVEMDLRYRLLASVGVKNIQGFNRKIEQGGIKSPETGESLEKLPYYVTIIDELADIMVTMGNEIYPPITRLSQMARAVGIHLVFATQRPSVDVVTGLIKANFPCRIAFQVTSKIDSRTILDVIGAEKLLGNGDMLYLPKNQPTPLRIQGAYISEAETERVASYWYDFSTDAAAIDLSEQVAVMGGGVADIDDELYKKAKELVIMHQQGSISLIQRRLRVGYARAARLIDMLEQAGVVGPFEGSKARRVLISREEYDGR